jgi:hypothetical protein
MIKKTISRGIMIVFFKNLKRPNFTELDNLMFLLKVYKIACNTLVTVVSCTVKFL